MGEHAAAPAAPSHPAAVAVVAEDGAAHAVEAAGPVPTAVSYPILFLFVTLLIGCFAKLVLQHIKERHKIGIPYSVVLLVLGMVLGGLSWLEERDTVHSSTMWTLSLTGWTAMSPRLILFIFLPALIFEGAAGTDYYIFQKQFPGGVMLAFPGMLVQIALIAMFAAYAFPYGWGWTESLLFGAILSATDPVAVIALMKELGLLSELRVLIEAESLLNDGSAIVVFELCHMILVHPATVQEYVSTGFQLVLGAPALGLGLFLASWFWLIKTDDPIQDTMVTVCSSYLCYFVAEAGGAHVSGVLSVLTMGVFMAGFGHTAIHTEHARHMLHAVWTVICWICDTVIFILAGAIIMKDGYLRYQDQVSATVFTKDWGYLFALYMTCLGVRSLVVLLCAPVIRWTGYGMQSRVLSTAKFLKYMVILSWGGLRGAVGLVLAMIVSQDTHLAAAVVDPLYGPRVLLFTGGMVLLTTLMNAASLESLVSLLGLAEPSETEKRLKKSAKEFLIKKHSSIKAIFQNRQNYPDLANVDWREVHRQVGPNALFADHYIHERHLAAAAEAASESTEDFEGLEFNKHHFLGRYLVSLRCSYACQFKNGLLSPLSYRRIITALSTAVDHANDGEGEASYLSELQEREASVALNGEAEEETADRARQKIFEWGWLEEMGFLDLPIWLKILQVAMGASCLDAVVSKHWRERVLHRWTRAEYARCIEISLAVSRAHEDTLRCEQSMLDDEEKELANEILFASQAIKELAENRYANLQYRMPEISCAVRTRQSCQLLLSRIEEEIETLHETAQISEAEFEQYEHILFHKRLHLTHVLPHTVGGDDGRNLLHYYFSDDDLKLLINQELEEVKQKANTLISKHKVAADSVYFIEHGMARIYKDAGGGRAPSQLLTPDNMSVSGSQFGNEGEDNAAAVHAGADTVAPDAGANAMPRKAARDLELVVTTDAAPASVELAPASPDAQAAEMRRSISMGSRRDIMEEQSAPAVQETEMNLMSLGLRDSISLDGRSDSPSVQHRHTRAGAASDKNLEKNEILIGAGCCFNDVEFLLKDAGYQSDNFGHLTTVTDVRYFRLRFEKLKEKPIQYNNFLERIWRFSGHMLCQRFPELLNHAPPEDWSWSSAVLSEYILDTPLQLSSCIFLVSGAIEQKQTKKRGSMLNLAAAATNGDIPLMPPMVHEALSFIMPLPGDVFKVCSGKCKVLSQGDIIMAPANVLSHRSPSIRPKTSTIERRSMELTRPISGLSKRLPPPIVVPPLSPTPARSRSMEIERRSVEFSRQSRRNWDDGNALGLRTGPYRTRRPSSLLDQQQRTKAMRKSSIPEHALDSDDQACVEDGAEAAEDVEIRPISVYSSGATVPKKAGERLRELKELLSEQLISQQEYDAQRTAIIASV